MTSSRERRRGHGRQDGFTLVELLVSMVVLAVVALAMTGALRFVVRAFAHTDDRRAALEELTLGFSVLRDELERAEPLMRRAGNESRVLFEGAPDRVRFVNVGPAYAGGRPYRLFELAVVGDGGGAYRVELRRAAFDPARPELGLVAEAEPRVLVRVPRPLAFTYYGQQRRGERPVWHEDWDRQPLLPAAVRLGEGEEPGWPELVVPLQIRAPYYCGNPEGGGAPPGGADGDEGTSATAAAPGGDGGTAANAGCEAPR